MAMSDTILFVVSPNLGIVDSWLPVLVELKRRNEQTRLVAFFPEAHILSRARPGDLLTELAHTLFDSVIFRDERGQWISLDDFKGAAAALHDHQSHTGIFNFLSSRRRADELVEDNNDYTSLLAKALPRNVGAVLFDIASEKRPLVRVLQEKAYPKITWFSLPHGIDLRTVHLSNKLKTLQPINSERSVKVTAYIASKTEVAVFQTAYGLKRDAIKLVGVPRHSNPWINTVRNHFGNTTVAKVPYIFLISRPKSSKYFSKARKIEALQDVQRVAQQLNYNIIVRRHPNESDDELFASAFSQRDYGTKWMYSNEHPFVLGAKAMFCVAFFSSVAVDMAVLGTPVIERCDFSGLTNVTGLESDAEGNPTSTYQKSGLVLGARSYQELRLHALRIIENRQEAIARARRAYDGLYVTIADPIGLIADDIEQSMQMAEATASIAISQPS
jgi:hypothetical protein